MSQNDDQATAREFLQAQDRLRGGPPDALCGPGYTFSVGGQAPMDLAGHQAFAAGFYAAFPDLRHEIEEIATEGDRVAVRFRLKGTNDGSFMDHPATGKPIDVGASALMRVADGKVQQLEGEFDEKDLMRQLA